MTPAISIALRQCRELLVARHQTAVLLPSSSKAGLLEWIAGCEDDTGTPARLRPSMRALKGWLLLGERCSVRDVDLLMTFAATRP